MSNFWLLPTNPILKIQKYPLSMLILRQKSPVWKLHNPYCHNLHISISLVLSIRILKNWEATTTAWRNTLCHVMYFRLCWRKKSTRTVQHKHAASFWWHNMVSFIIFHQRSVKRFLVRLMIPPKGQMMMVQQLQLDLERL